MFGLKQTDISVIGLGPMGRALAKTLLNTGACVAVWNRTQAKSRQLMQQGAWLAENVSQALLTSPVILLNLTNYEVTHKVLAQADLPAGLQGKVIIQLATGTPEEARQLSTWVQQHGGHYLDGSIMCWPDSIGTKDAFILVSGSVTAYEKAQKQLAALAGEIIHLGEDPGTASAMDEANYCFWIAAVLGFTHGVRICESEGISLHAYKEMLIGGIPMITGQLNDVANTMINGNFSHTLASIFTYSGAVDRLVEQAESAQISTQFPRFAQQIFRQAIKAGHGNDDLAALIHVFRTPSEKTEAIVSPLSLPVIPDNAEV